MFDLKDYETKINFNKIGNAYLTQNSSKKPYILTNDNNINNFDNKDDYLVLNTKHDGGVLVIFPTDVTFTWINDTTILGCIIADIIEYLTEKGIVVYSDGNDLMYNGKKIFGLMSDYIGDKYYEGMFFSFDPDINVIKSVCRKEMKKEPFGLGEFGITPEEIITLCKTLIKRYGLKEVK